MAVDLGGRQMSAPAVSVFTSSGGPLNKRFLLDGGEIRKETRATLYAGTAETVDVPNAEALSALLSRLSGRQALSVGALRGGRRAAITTQARADGSSLARTLDNFEFRAAPGWLLWDYDDKTMPPEVRARVAELGGPLEALFQIWPEARDGEFVVVASSSDGVTAPSIDTLRSDGRHGYFLVADISRAREALDALQARAWRAGLGWYALSKAGAVLERSIVDTAVGSPERLIFEAPPELVAPVTRDARAPLVHCGHVLQIPDAPDVSEIRARAHEAIKPAARKAEAQFIEDQADKVARETGTSLEAARAIVRRRKKGRILYDDDVIYGPGGGAIRVADLLERRPHGLGMPDPEEGPDYGMTSATFLWGEGYAAPRLVSHAHGTRTVYRFARHMTPVELESAESGAVRLELPLAADLPDGKEKTLLEALRGADKATALPVAVAVAHKLQNRVPHRMDVDQVMAFIADNLPGKHLSTAEMDAVRGRVEWLVSYRKTAALGRSDLPVKARERHRVRRLKSLEDLPDLTNSGVMVLKAPPGAGKTQLVGRPFVAAARAAGRSVLAITHRITLTAELARRLGLPDYQVAGMDDVVRGVAACLPSILRPDIAEALPRPDVVFIDEIAQVLQFLANEMCAGSGGDAQAVFERLQQVVRDARQVLVADAGIDTRTIEFLERCRPGETFDIIEVPPAPRDKSAEVFQSADMVIDRVAEELAEGGKVWLACEGAEKAEALAAMFLREGYRVMCITARTKLRGDAAAFLADAEASSRSFDLVVSSPAISSGLSIEHAEGEHFTLGAFIGAGSAIPPEDAMQQLGRVRYLRRFLIGLELSNLSGGIRPDAIREGIEGAALVEGVLERWTSFDTFCADVNAQALNARSDFGAGLWWLLERDGWRLQRCGGGRRGQLLAAEDDYRANRAAELMAAAPMTSHQAEVLRRMVGRALEDETRLEAHEIRLEMGTLDLTAEDIDAWDGGRGRGTRERFEDLTGADAWRDEGQKALTSRRFRHARARLYADLFDGISWDAPIPMAVCDVILNRVMARPETYAAVGIVGPKYQSRKAGPGGTLKPVQRPKQAGREVAEILKRAGLVVRRVAVPGRLKTRFSSILGQGILSQEAARPDGRDYAVAVRPESVEAMRTRLQRRAAFDIDAALATQAPQPETVVPSERLAWAGAERFAAREQKRRDAERLAAQRAEFFPVPKKGQLVPELSPEPQPVPVRRLIILPEPEQLVAQHKLAEPVSHYVIEDDRPRLTWSREMAEAVRQVFREYEAMNEWTPDAWR